MADRERARMHWKQYAGIMIFAGYGVGFCVEIAGVWPVLVGRLGPAHWIELTLIHVVLLISMANLYVNARKRAVSGTFDVLFAAGTALMVSGLDLSLLSMPGVR